MLRELYTAALGMIPQQTRLEVIANNIANSNTTGFKRSSVFERNLIEAKSNFFNVPGDNEQDDPPTGSYIDFSQGAFEKTDNNLDLAVDKKNAFLVFEDADGSKVLSKNGQLTIDENGYLIGVDGKKLMGTNGPINLGNEYKSDPFITNDKKAMDIKITQTGEVFANNEEIGTIQLAKIDDLNSLENIANSDFIATKDTDINYIPQDEVVLRQGWIENSNVNVIKEMVDMIELERLFQTGSKVITTNDSTLATSISIGRFY